jgi:hypothetical protein
MSSTYKRETLQDSLQALEESRNDLQAELDACTYECEPNKYTVRAFYDCISMINEVKKQLKEMGE